MHVKVKVSLKKALATTSIPRERTGSTGKVEKAGEKGIKLKNSRKVKMKLKKCIKERTQRLEKPG